MIVYPAIDIYQGRVVRMTRGDFSTVEELQEVATTAAEAGASLIYSGGIGSLDDIRAVARLRHRGIRGIIVGRAIYLGKFSLRDAVDAARSTAA